MAAEPVQADTVLRMFETWWPLFGALAGQLVFLGITIQQGRGTQKGLERLEAEQKSHHDEDKEEFRDIREQVRECRDEAGKLRTWLAAVDPQGFKHGT